jgi:phospholipid/cholesterol/gamma-HCH transport system substrate-binding protein
MASVSPPRPPAAPPPPPRSGSGPKPVHSRPVGAGRMLAIGGLGLVVLIVAYLVFVGGGGATYKLEFEDAGQLVKGDEIQVGGVPSGTIKNIQLTKSNKALVTIHVNGSLTPLHEGTTAEIRVPSLSSVAARFIALSLGANNKPALPDGATLPITATKGVVDIDQLFDTLNPRTRKGLQGVIEGFAEQYTGAEEQAGIASGYFGPALNAAGHVFAEFANDQQTLEKFLVSTSDALTIIGAHSEHLSDLIGNADTTFQSVAAHQKELAEGLKGLPGALNAGTKTFTEIPSTFHVLGELLKVSTPDTRKLAPFFAKLRPLLEVATPVVKNLSLAIDRPGPNDDLTDAALELPALAQELTTGSPATVKSLEESVPVTAMFGPYSPDFEGLFREFGQDLAYYDANGHYARVAGTFDGFKLGEKDTLTPTTPQQGLEGLKTGELRRCPGGGTQPAADGSSPFEDEGKLSCDPSEHP